MDAEAAARRILDATPASVMGGEMYQFATADVMGVARAYLALLERQRWRPIACPRMWLRKRRSRQCQQGLTLLASGLNE